MQDLLDRIIAGLRAGSYANERAVSTSIVVPVLRALDWDDTDPESVRPEYVTGNGRVDYALFPRVGAPAVFLEVKGVGKSAEADRQLFQYAFHEGAQIAVLTDGRLWNFYLPGEHGNYEDRRVYQLDLLERPLEEAQYRFQRYLNRPRVLRGEALADAREDYRSRASQRAAEAKLPVAWAELLSEPDADLINLLRERTEALSGHRPTDSALEAFLTSRSGVEGRQSVPRQQRTPAARVADTVQAVADGARLEYSGSEQPNSWRVGTRSGVERDQVSAMVAFLSALFLEHPDRQEQMAAAVRTRTRNNIARAVADVYPEHPELAARAHRALPNGWFVGTNESSATKMRICMQAANACALTWGSDAMLNL